MYSCYDLSFTKENFLKDSCTKYLCTYNNVKLVLTYYERAVPHTYVYILYLLTDGNVKYVQQTEEGGGRYKTYAE